MVNRPRLLDLFCGAGGCSVGYARAGFDVVGVDMRITALRRYPFPCVCADALAVLRDGDLSGFDVIHASPPCQAYSITKNAHTAQHPDLLQPVLDLLTEWGGVWVVENVPGAPMPPDLTITLCGAHRRTFDHYTGRVVRLRRHRLFASNAPLLAHPCECDGTPVGGVYRGAWSKNRTLDPAVRRTGGYTPPDDVQRQLMGIDWMTRHQLAQAIPPDYTETVGRQVLEFLR